MLMTIRIAIVVLALLSAALQISAKECLAGKGRVSALINGYKVEAKPDPKDPDLCVATVAVSGKQPVFRAYDRAFEIDAASGKDIDGDGAPDVVLTSYTGGAHCCWTYWIVSLGSEPGLSRKICNDRQASFKDLDGDGRIEIVTLDGSFDYFDGMSHAFSPFPPVVLQLSGHKLRRLNERFPDLYIKEINAARARLTAADLVAFKTKPFEEFPGPNREDTKQQILTIVLAKLYMGNERDAHAALHKYWLPSDEKRIWKLILKTAGEGFLGDVNRPNYGCIE